MRTIVERLYSIINGKMNELYLLTKMNKNPYCIVYAACSVSILQNIFRNTYNYFLYFLFLVEFHKSCLSDLHVKHTNNEYILISDSVLSPT